MKFTGFFAAVLAAASVASGASAQSGEDAARWASINAAAPAPSVEAVRQVLAVSETDCPSAAPVLGPVTPVTAWSVIDTAIAEGQIANAWLVTVTRPECPGEQAHARFVVVRGIGDSLSAQLLNVGRSHADAHDLNDGAMLKAMRTVGSSAARDIPGCSGELISRTGRLLRTEIVDDSKLGRNVAGRYVDGEWRESWIFAACGRQLSVFVDFKGGPDGVTATPSAWASLKR
ncbi:MAG: hypothetical protein KA105_01185 [Caulobacter sp.]|nr:hypothetical protein [Caulobacter sp.]